MGSDEALKVFDGVGLAFTPDGRPAIMVLRTPDDVREWWYWARQAEDLPFSEGGREAVQRANNVAWKATETARAGAAVPEPDRQVPHHRPRQAGR